jgi:hypothetical protein
MKEKRKMRIEQGQLGSALIMTVVLTVMLSIVAVMFVAVARMDMASTGNIADNKALESSVKSIIELINRQLVLDTPGVAEQEYYDYPDANNAWLASIEPYESASNYYWRQISDVTGYLRSRNFETQDVNVDPNPPLGPGTQDVIRDYPEITLTGGQLNDLLADADGDGIADSKWFELANMRSSKGKPIYAAVRIIDNSGMVNINTADIFDPTSSDSNKIDGSSQMQINLKGLLKGTSTEIDNQFNALLTTRCGTAPSDGNSYTQNVIWRYGKPNGNYLPFDISDELELRYRYCIDSKFVSRLERGGASPVIPDTMKGYGIANSGYLYNGDGNWGLGDWLHSIINPADPSTDRRHMLTSLNLDRIITPDGNKMTNINTADVNDIYNLFTRIGFDADTSAQIAVNIIDYRDSDSSVTDFNVGTAHYYGFEQPCIYISELAYNQSGTNKSYAIELYRPYPDVINPADVWQLSIQGLPYVINFTANPWPTTKDFYVIKNDPSGSLSVDLGGAAVSPDSASIVFSADNTIELSRVINGNSIAVDSIIVPSAWPSAPIADGNYSIQRDITPHKCIRRLESGIGNNLTLGRMNDYNTAGDANYIQAHPKNLPFTNIGELGMIFRNPAYYPAGGGIPANTIGYNNNVRQEYQVRLNLADPNYQEIFEHLTVIDPNNFYPNDPNYAGETRVKGRININTAPAFVLAQLPWVLHRPNDYNLARAIVAYRDKTAVPSGDPDYSNRPDPCGFGTIGQLCDVCDINSGTIINYGINYYGRDGIDQPGFPDLTTTATGDSAIDDFEERDLIFARISNLVTVRSDMFTAYILVRIGTDGPQKRCITILDRSDVGFDPNGVLHDDVKIRAFQTTPEAR